MPLLVPAINLMDIEHNSVELKFLKDAKTVTGQAEGLHIIWKQVRVQSDNTVTETRNSFSIMHN